MSYNGYKNYSTWNVSLWISNDEDLYFAAVNFMKGYKGARPYSRFIHSMRLQNEQTPDNIKWISTCLDYKALNEMMNELID